MLPCPIFWEKRRLRESTLLEPDIEGGAGSCGIVEPWIRAGAVDDGRPLAGQEGRAVRIRKRGPDLNIRRVL